MIIQRQQAEYDDDMAQTELDRVEFLNINDAIEYMKENNERKYWGMMNEDYVPHVDVFWRGLEELCSCIDHQVAVKFDEFLLCIDTETATALENDIMSPKFVVDDAKMVPSNSTLIRVVCFSQCSELIGSDCMGRKKTLFRGPGKPKTCQIEPSPLTHRKMTCQGTVGHRDSVGPFICCWEMCQLEPSPLTHFPRERMYSKSFITFSSWGGNR